MKIHLRVTCLVGYGYSQGGSYEQSSPYQLVFSAFLFGDGTAYLFATHGEMSMQWMAQIGQALNTEHGVTKVSAHRNGRLIEYSVEQMIRRAERDRPRDAGAADGVVLKPAVQLQGQPDPLHAYLVESMQALGLDASGVTAEKAEVIRECLARYRAPLDRQG